MSKDTSSSTSVCCHVYVTYIVLWAPLLPTCMQPYQEKSGGRWMGGFYNIECPCWWMIHGNHLKSDDPEAELGLSARDIASAMT